jgi:hypothetical protein
MLAYCRQPRNWTQLVRKTLALLENWQILAFQRHMDTCSSATYVRPWDCDTESPTFTPRSTCAAQSAERDWSVTDARSAPAL